MMMMMMMILRNFPVKIRFLLSPQRAITIRDSAGISGTLAIYEYFYTRRCLQLII
jgi:hypothetical protein